MVIFDQNSTYQLHWDFIQSRSRIYLSTRHRVTFWIKQKGRTCWIANTGNVIHKVDSKTDGWINTATLSCLDSSGEFDFLMRNDFVSVCHLRICLQALPQKHEKLQLTLEFEVWRVMRSFWDKSRKSTVIPQINARSRLRSRSRSRFEFSNG
jgi:hypothetical protein